MGAPSTAIVVQLPNIKRTHVHVKHEIDTDDLVSFVEFVTGGREGYADVFGHGYIGYWAYGVEHDAERGWLIFEHGDEIPRSEYKQADFHEAAIARWEAGAELPKGYFRLSRETAVLAYAQGLQWKGEDWQPGEIDAPATDVVLQRVLFGKVVYA